MVYGMYKQKDKQEKNKMSGTTNGNQHKSHPCHYCWQVLYSKGALTAHVNKYHWEEVVEDEEPLEEDDVPS